MTRNVRWTEARSPRKVKKTTSSVSVVVAVVQGQVWYAGALKIIIITRSKSQNMDGHGEATEKSTTASRSRKKSRQRVWTIGIRRWPRVK